MNPKQKSLDDVQSYITRISERKGWKLHPNDDGTLDDLIEGLQGIFNRLGYFNCPCRDSEEDRAKDSDIICPCAYAPPDIEEYGHCYCALYFDNDFDFSQPIEMIPERRPENPEERKQKRIS